MKWHTLTFLASWLIPVALMAQSEKSTPPLISSSAADTWVARDGLGRLAGGKGEGIRTEKYVGIFYFVWQGAHGYDQHSGTDPDEGVMQKKPSDTLSPYDISKLLKADPEQPKYGPLHAFHYWSEPYFGYYLPDDEWIIRKHAQMLSDAGVDVIILDVTNASIYFPQVSRIAAVYTAMRKQGISTPSIAFIANSNPVATVDRLYDKIYSRGLFKDLWFYWKGKPLLLAPPEGQKEEVRRFFSIRQSWAWSKDQQWFGDGKDKWTWVDHTPQAYGWHDAPDRPEQISVSAAEHPMSNIGRSFHNGKEPLQKNPGAGLYFKEQWERALAVDPEFIFVTGWNEWVAMRFNDGASRSFLGRAIPKGETYFVDLYNEEYSRDIEPMKNGFNDNYYYQLVHYIRAFKGNRALRKEHSKHQIKVDGNFKDWTAVQARYKDDQGDTQHRDHPGWGRIQAYRNLSGRNDIIESRVAVDDEQIAFYVKTAEPLSSWNSGNWMKLYLQVDGAGGPDWSGYQYLLNAHPRNARLTSVSKSRGGNRWISVGQAKYSAKGNEMELVVPRKALGLAKGNFTLDFKWADQVPDSGRVMDFLDHGDAAPNGRFNYRFIYQEGGPHYTDHANLVATDALGRKLIDFESAGPPKKDKFVGLFYWTWHTQLGKDNPPFNTAEYLAAAPGAKSDFHHPVWPKRNSPWFWSEPLFGYYLDTDEWVLRKHAEMLADAGVDVLIFDCTNGNFTWKESYMKLAEVFSKARKDGVRTPQIAFMLPFGPTPGSREIISALYSDLYKPGRYPDLWFHWKGKPLIMAYPENLDPELRDFFTFRPGQPLYDKGPQREDHWGWLEIFPQHGFVKTADGYEQAVVGVAQNWTAEKGLSAMNSPGAFGRSYTHAHGQHTEPIAVNYGYNFQEQWERALEIDPEFIFITGWNEWIAGRAEKWEGQPNAFPDEFDQEGSRDIEMMKGGHGDNYYYQMVNNIRRFKGMSPPSLVSGPARIAIDGAFEDWNGVRPEYEAYRGNTLHRDSPGWGSLHYTNESGRNDIILAKVAQDADNLYFYVKTAEPMSSSADPAWMRLFLDIDRDKHTGWEGYDFVVNRLNPQEGAFLERSDAGWNWQKAGKVGYTVKGTQMELRIPKTLLGLTGKIDFEFKWADNTLVANNIMDFWLHGDAAPAGRFNFHYKGAD